MSIGNDCPYEYSVDRLFDFLSEGRLPSASEAALEIFDVCRTCNQRERPGIARMMTEDAATSLAYKNIGAVLPYPADRSLHLVVAPSFEMSPRVAGAAAVSEAEIAE